MKNINWKQIQNHYDNGGTYKSIYEIFGICSASLAKAKKKGLFVSRTFSEASKIAIKKHPRQPMTEDTKKKLSESRKKFLKENPDKITWRREDVKISQPCENVKIFLRKNGIQFVSEFDPGVEGRFFSVDIAIPEKQILIEINGNQHYNKDGSLKDYYQERHDLISSLGWVIYEVHYTDAFNEEKWNNFCDFLKGQPIKVNFDYENYEKKQSTKNIKYNYCKCGRQMWQNSSLCFSCTQNQKGIHIPSKEELEKLVLEMPMTHISKLYGVSDVAVKKWCKKRGINLPNRRGFWTKKTS